ncbi:hypothetical protein DLE60_03435 [Micromonospora globispora]|nr:hypothetical protein DLE60_03435 [Micromonospora globispora]RQW98455.1 hypothetical protein DKL51_10400 [Micromonospora globispora]
MVFTIAITLCGVAASTAGAAVYPMLGRVSRHRSHRGTIYFGHLRHRDPADLAEQLERLTPTEHFNQLSQQLTAMAKRNWWKHRILQGALLIATIGYIAIFLVVMV